MKKWIIIAIFFQILSFHVDSYAGPIKKFSSTFKYAKKIILSYNLTKYEKYIIKRGRLEKINNRKVLTTDKNINTKKRDALGRTNCDRMDLGLAPIGNDDLPIILHHLEQKNNGIIVELMASEHHKYSKDLHYHRTSSEIDRYDFNKWKQKYWKIRGKKLCK